MTYSLYNQRRRKPKAPTLRETDWKPYKDIIIDMHITQGMSLSKVRSFLEAKHKFVAEISQYRFRISKWGLDKNTKTREMKAIVRKRQYRTLVESDKAELEFHVRGQKVHTEDIERWMRRHDVPKDELYHRSPEPPTPADVRCLTISERATPVPDLSSVASPGCASPPAFSSPSTLHLVVSATQPLRVHTPQSSETRQPSVLHSNDLVSESINNEWTQHSRTTLLLRRFVMLSKTGFVLLLAYQPTSSDNNQRIVKERDLDLMLRKSLYNVTKAFVEALDSFFKWQNIPDDMSVEYRELLHGFYRLAEAVDWFEKTTERIIEDIQRSKSRFQDLHNDTS